MKGLKFLTMDELVTEYNRLMPVGQWFVGAGTTFWKRRVAQSAYLIESQCYFISSEIKPGHKRLYTIRSMNAETGEITNIGSFQQHNYISARKTLAAILGIKVNQL